MSQSDSEKTIGEGFEYGFRADFHNTTELVQALLRWRKML